MNSSEERNLVSIRTISALSLDNAGKDAVIKECQRQSRQYGLEIERLKKELAAMTEAEHAQRLTLQHHACDQAQRIADLEAKCVTIKELNDAAADERDALRARLAEIEAQEPVCHLYLTDYRGYANMELQGWEDLPIGEHKLYARPVPAPRVS